jgi:hypothetical protein
MAEGALPDILVACQNQLPRVQFEATRCVANLSSYGTTSRAACVRAVLTRTHISVHVCLVDDLQRQIVDEGAIDVMLQIIHKPDALPLAKLEAIRCISNLAFHGNAPRLA